MANNSLGANDYEAVEPFPSRTAREVAYPAASLGNTDLDPLSKYLSPANSEESRQWTFGEVLDRLEVEISRHLQTEEALRETREHFRQLSEHSGKFLWVSDAQTKELLYVSPGFEEVWSRSRERNYISPEEWLNAFNPPKNNSSTKSRPSKGTAGGSEPYQIAGADGSARWIRDRMFPIRNESGEVIRMLGIAEDVTEMKTISETLARSERRAKALLAALPDLIFCLRKDGLILEAKAAKEKALSSDPGCLVGKNVNDLLPPQIARQVMHYVHLTLRTEHVQTFTCEYLLPDDLRDFEARGVVCGDNEVLAIVRDVSERKRLEKEILEISSREQQRIGQDLHDGLGQHLTGITFLSKALEKKLAARMMVEAAEAGEIGKLVIQALAQTRNLARGLFPIELEHNGLASALQELTSNVERLYNVRCSFESDGSVVVQENVFATHLFRIAQEAIHNAVKHGKPTSIRVSLKTFGGTASFEVLNDGQVFIAQDIVKGLGLKIMQYRARRIGGHFEISPAGKEGTRLMVSFPAALVQSR